MNNQNLFPWGAIAGAAICSSFMLAWQVASLKQDLRKTESPVTSISGPAELISKTDKDGNVTHFATQRVSETAFLFAIMQVESGGDYQAVSADGEHWGAYQISHDIFSQYWGATASGVNHATLSNYLGGKFLCAIPADDQTACALWWLRKLEKPGEAFNVRSLAALWLGANNADYCDRVDNLYRLRLSQLTQK